MSSYGICLECSLHFFSTVKFSDAMKGVFPGPVLTWTHTDAHLVVQGWRQ